MGYSKAQGAWEQDWSVQKEFLNTWAEPGVLRVEAEEFGFACSAPRTKALEQGINSVIRHPFVLIAP